MLGAATPPKWDHALEALFDELSKALVQRTAVEKSIGLLVHTCNLARSNVQKGILKFWLSEHESRVHYIRVH